MHWGAKRPHYVVCVIHSLGCQKTPVCRLRNTLTGYQKTPLCRLRNICTGYQKTPLCRLRIHSLGCKKTPLSCLQITFTKPSMSGESVRQAPPHATAAPPLIYSRWTCYVICVNALCYQLLKFWISPIPNSQFLTWDL